MTEKIDYPFLITRLHSACDYNWEPDFSFEGERHDFWELVCVLDGEVEAIEDDRVYLLSVGNLLCHAPMEFHRIRAVHGTRPHVLVLSFETKGSLPPVLSEGIFLLTLPEMEEYHAVFKRFFSVYFADAADPYRDAEAVMALSAFLIRMAEAHTPFARVSKMQRAKTYQALVQTMYDHLYENLSLSEIAERNAVSTSTVKALFADFAGMGPMHYYAQLRGQEALHLLERGLSVTEVSNKLNFSSPNYFLHFFKSQFSVLPSKYKK